jgi:hypothetical protein
MLEESVRLHTTAYCKVFTSLRGCPHVHILCTIVSYILVFVKRYIENKKINISGAGKIAPAYTGRSNIFVCFRLVNIFVL